MRKAAFPLVVCIACYGLFAAVWATRNPVISGLKAHVFDRVVVSAPVQVLMSGGDRFLAANLESFRAVATVNDAPEATESNASFAIRARRVVSQLNPCHEDNYYYGNALLTWGGAVAEGTDLLRRAMECREWDELPAFFYGFNQFYFLHNIAEAQRALGLAAERSVSNAAVFRKLTIMLAVGEFKDDAAALDYLVGERDRATDPQLKQMLDKRVGRLEGLIQLRTAQQRYEMAWGKALTDPAMLVEQGFLQAFPVDPMKIGYEFVDGRFRLKEIQIAGMENAK